MQQIKNGWINMLTAKPSKATYHLTHSKEGMTTISVWNHKEWRSLDNNIVTITHWMPLPETPTK
jgi:hypothetical protein